LSLFFGWKEKRKCLNPVHVFTKPHSFCSKAILAGLNSMTKYKNHRVNQTDDNLLGTASFLQEGKHKCSNDTAL